MALEQVTGLDEKPHLECEDVAFTIAPRLNAAGRLGQAPLAVELLMTDSPERARKLAEFIHGLNEQRQSLERSVYRAANKRCPRNVRSSGHAAALVLAGRGWHPGVIGIVAGRLAEEYHRPVVLISLDELGTKPAMGSGRSIAGFNLHAALAACGQHLSATAGTKRRPGSRSTKLRSTPSAPISAPTQPARFRAEDCAAELFVDAETPLSALTHQTVRQIESLAPFGHGNERPVLCTSDVRLAEPPKRIGSTGRHLALRFEQHGVALRAVAFGGGDWEQDLTDASGPLAVAFKPVINHFRGRQPSKCTSPTGAATRHSGCDAEDLRVRPSTCWSCGVLH